MFNQHMIESAAKQQIIGMSNPPSMTERLEAQRDSLKAQLERVEAALDAIRKSPDVEAAVNAISGLCGYI